MYDLEILAVYQKCGITSFPIDCDKILKSYGYDIKNYIQASGSAQELRALRSYSTDAFTDHVHKIIYYNDAVTVNRIRFSKMHELGHIVLETEDDKKADEFASNILAPRGIAYALKLMTAEDIAKFFCISTTAANNVIYGLYRYYPDIDAAEVIRHFGYKGRCPELFPEPDPEPVWPKVPERPVKTEEQLKAEKLRRTKQIRSLRGKIKRARLKMVEATDEATYYKYRQKVWDAQKRLDMVLGKDPFEDFR